MKKLFKSTGFTIILATLALVFMLWAFFFGGVEYMVNSISPEQSLVLFRSFIIIMILSMLGSITVGVVKSIKIENKNKIWRKSMGVGDKVHVSSYGGPGEDGEILGIDQDDVFVKIKVSKSRVYRLND